MATPNPEDEFYMWLGKCIASWSSVENHLFNICTLCLGATAHQSAIIYYRTPTIDSRLSLVDELVKSRMPAKAPGEHDHDDLKLWDRLRKDIALLLATRNRLAHHPVVGKTIFGRSADPEAAGMLNQYSSWFTSEMSEAEKLRRRREDEKPLMVDDLSYHRMCVEDRIGRLKHFETVTLAAHL